ncbi:MAG: hypothetical protein GY859_23380 [Desulfobacterales bacterium]|nr:hypothetical protein [Desulfobacterales bacterium]
MDVTPAYLDIGDLSPISPPVFEALGDVGVNLTVNDGAIAFEFLQPDGFSDAADQTFTITWTDDVPGTDASIHLFYDADAAGADGEAINAEAISEDDETDSYTWGVSGIVDGDYYIYARVDDGVNPPEVYYSPGPLTVGEEVPDVCTDPLGVCSSCPGESVCRDTLQEGLDYAATDDDPFTSVFVGAGEYEGPVTISGSMVVILEAGTGAVIIGGGGE